MEAEVVVNWYISYEMHIALCAFHIIDISFCNFNKIVNWRAQGLHFTNLHTVLSITSHCAVITGDKSFDVKIT